MARSMASYFVGAGASILAVGVSFFAVSAYVSFFHDFLNEYEKSHAMRRIAMDKFLEERRRIRALENREKDVATEPAE